LTTARWDLASRSQRVTAARWDPASRSRSKERRLGTDAVRDDRMREEVACRRRWRTGRRRGGRRRTGRRRWGQRRTRRSKGIRVEREEAAAHRRHGALLKPKPR